MVVVTAMGAIDDGYSVLIIFLFLVLLCIVVDDDCSGLIFFFSDVLICGFMMVLARVDLQLCLGSNSTFWF